MSINVFRTYFNEGVRDPPNLIMIHKSLMRKNEYDIRLVHEDTLVGLNEGSGKKNKSLFLVEMHMFWRRFIKKQHFTCDKMRLEVINGYTS